MSIRFLLSLLGLFGSRQVGYLKLLRTFSYLENHRNHLLIYLIISIDISHEQFAGFCTLLVRLVHNGSEPRSNKGSSITIGETDDGHIFRYAKSLGLDGIKGSIGDDVIKGKNGIWRIGALKQPKGIVASHLEVYLVAHHKVSVYRDTVSRKASR